MYIILRWQCACVEWGILQSFVLATVILFSPPGLCICKGSLGGKLRSSGSERVGGRQETWLLGMLWQQL